ncbi:MAG: response regulator [Bacillota bacterium]
MEKKVLVVDDEKSLADAVSYAFRKEGFEVRTAYDGFGALKVAEEFNPKVIILDIMMQGMDGFEVCRNLKSKDNVGIILLTAKGDIVDKVLGLELGADDYITKPFDIRELIARVKSLIRRLSKNKEERIKSIKYKDLEIIIEQRKVLVDKDEIVLTPKEFDLLYLLVSNPERVFTREELLDMVWGMEYVGGTRTVDIHVQRLRKKLGQDYQSILQTVFGVGYKAMGDFDED